MAEMVISNPEESDTIRFAEEVAPLVRPGDLLILTGGLGAGKTFFTRALCYALGLDEEEPVTSPTFTLVQEYPTLPPLIHADLYRLVDEEDVFELGLEFRRQEGHVLVVEWGAPFVEVLGGDAIHFDLTLSPRSLTIRGEGRRAQEFLAELRQQRGVSHES